ncbi:type 2 lanthipeptide synthetase LanM family protein [Mammaliicoccus sciuri]|uniref:type 2 lanthipeptide synthetase LanM family protein n=1 Tax=Mammaliicoccus sciuri TaxID=1296 RepID=UPI000D1DBB64|nr:type 2 lanthipeptide synthetase LanM family protein [Mammaliicoccus sciuri]PTK00126.1 hypothetical protein BUZ87_13080 [Mammaliicoccus sciuri]
MSNLINIIKQFIPDSDESKLNTITNTFFDMNFSDFEDKYYMNNKSPFQKEVDLEKYKNSDFKSRPSTRGMNVITDYIIYCNDINYTNCIKGLSYIDNKKVKRINDDILYQLSIMLMKFLYRTVVYDINKKRTKNLFFNTDEKEQFKEYLEELKDNKKLFDFIEKYPSLIQAIENYLYQLHKNILQFFHHLKNDESSIAEKFQCRTQNLDSISLAQGDLHNQGKMVIHCTYEEGSIFYKPRKGDVDLLFSDLLSFFNKNTNHDLQATNNLIKSNYFWVKGVDYKECNSKSEVSNFYYELGIILAFLYIFDATDFHAENLISHGSHPILIDLESLIGNRNFRDFSDATDFNRYLLSSSVKSTGILPFIFGDNESSDVSAIGKKGANQSSIKVPKMSNIGTSNIAVRSEYIDIEASKNHPKLNNEYVDSELYTSDVKKGFSIAYDFILKEQKNILELIKRKAKNVFLRHINKPTMFYTNLINLSYHPLVIQNIALRDFFIASQLIQEKNDLIIQEFEDMIQSNVPYFSYNLCSKELNHHSPMTYNNYFKTSSFDNIKNKFSLLSNIDKNKQLMFIENSMLKNTLINDDKDKNYCIKNYKNIDDHDYTKKHKEKLFNYIIMGVEEQITKYQIEYKNTYSWNSGTLYGEGDKKTYHDIIMTENLYDGLCGMAFYYYSLYLYTENKKYLLKSEDIVSNVRSYTIENTNLPIGAFEGVFSYVYLCGLLYKTTRNNQYLDDCIRIIKNFKSKLECDETNDFISGNAGILTVLINLYTSIEIDIYKNVIYDSIKTCVNRIYSNRIELNENEVTWEFVNKQHLTGFAHGNSGVSYALKLYLQKIEYSVEIEELTSKADNYEDRYREGDLWINHNKNESPPFAWCYGSPGILLNRSMNSKMKNDNMKIAEEILSQGFSRTHCLCHGDLGNAIILEKFIEKEKLSNILYDILHGVTIEKLQCGVGVPEIQNFNLMTGLSGISYGLMYILKNDIPNVLILEI